MMQILIMISKRIGWWYLLPFVLLGALLFSEIGDTFPLFPENISQDAMYVYTDSADGGASKILPPDTPGDVTQLKYELHDTKNFFIPYVGYSIRLKEVEDRLDLTTFDHMTLNMSVEHRQTCYVLLNMYVEEGSSLDSSIRDVSLTCELPLYSDKNEYTLSLDDLFIPDWWLYENKLDDDSIDRRFLKRIRTINLHFGAQDNNYANEIHLHGISFSRDKGIFYIYWLCATFVYLLLLWGIQLIVKQHLELLGQREKIVVPYDTLDQISVDVDVLKQIVQFIGTHYTEEGLSIHDVVAACEVESGRIIQLLSEHFQGVTFPQYLNMIRVYEAKRLLLKSEMNISEIGYAVGFSNVTHFNRTFKKILEITPSALRKMEQERTEK